MTNSATQPRTAASTAKGLIFAALTFPLGIASVPALANGIQMLPPVTEATKLSATPTPCPPGGASNILTWDGTNPISCSTGVTVTGGAVGIGTTSPQAALDVDGNVILGARNLVLGADTNRFGNSGLRLLNTGTSPGAYSSQLTLMPFTGGTADIRLYNGYDPTGTNVGAMNLGFNSNPSTFVFALGSFGTGIKPTAYAFLNGNVGIGTTTPNSSLDLSTQTDAISLPSGTTGQEPSSPTPGMTRYNTDISKLEYWNGTTWVPVATSNPQVTNVTGWLPYGAVAHYLDCPVGFTEISCNSVESPSGQFTCDTNSGIDPNTGNSACVQAGCGQGIATDRGYYTDASCIKF